MLTFLHAADIHLDSPLRGLARYDGAPLELLRGASRRAFENLVRSAIEERVAFLVISGDLYDGEWKDFNTGLFFARQLGRLREAGVEVVVLHGNHDAESSLTRALRLDGVHVFPAGRAGTIRLERWGVALHGQSFKTAETTDNLVPGYPEPIPGLLNLGVLHTALEGHAEHARYAPCTVEELENKGYGYWALGHVHAARIVRREPWVVYPGNLQGRHAREVGAKGAIRVAVEDREIVGVEAVAFDVLRWAHLQVDAGGAATRDGVEDRVREALAAAIRSDGDGRPLAVRVSITGATRAHHALLAHEEGFRADLQGIAAGLGADVAWIEKIRLATAPEGAPVARTDGAVDDLRRTLDEAAADPELRQALQADLQTLLDKLPAEARRDLEPGPLADLQAGRLESVIAEALPLLRARLDGAEG